MPAMLAGNSGADGCEVDLRRTRDGVLVLCHDDMLDQPTRKRTRALKSAAPWAMELPRARPCPTAD